MLPFILSKSHCGRTNMGFALLDQKAIPSQAHSLFVTVSRCQSGESNSSLHIVLYPASWLRSSSGIHLQLQLQSALFLPAQWRSSPFFFTPETQNDSPVSISM